MSIICLVAVFPVDVQYHELPRVECREFIVEAKSVAAAYEEMSGWAQMVDATEVWGVKLRELCITPDRKHIRQEDLGTWEHWTRWQLSDDSTGWKRVALGPETFRQRLDRQFAERHPEFA